MQSFGLVVIGCSAGGIAALEEILKNLDVDIVTPLAIVQHMSADTGDSILNLLKKYSAVEVSEPFDKELIQAKHIYIAPADYHLMVESDRSFNINMGPKENYSRPSIDVLFETAAEVYKDKTLGILLTGANRDGAKGIISIKKFSGTTVAQDPKEALVSVMPKSAIDTGCVDYIYTLKEIGEMLNRVLKE